MTELPALVSDQYDDLNAAFGSNDHPQLRRLAHQMKGAAGGYGYPTISSAAGDLEHMIDGGETDASNLEAQFNQLVHLCRCAQAGAK